MWQRWETLDIDSATLADDATTFEDSAVYMPSLAAERTFDSDVGPWETGRLSAMWQVPQDNRYQFFLDTDGTQETEFYVYAVGDARVTHPLFCFYYFVQFPHMISTNFFIGQHLLFHCKI